MEMTQTAPQSLSMKDYQSAGNYDEFLQAVRDHFAANLSRFGNKLFRTHVGALDTSPFNALYLGGIGQHGENEAQHYNCRCCRRFMNNFGDLAFVDPETGKVYSAFWNADNVPEFFKPAVAAMQDKVERSSVKSVFVPNQRELGIALAGNFNHFAVVVPEFMVWGRADIEAHQAEANFTTEFAVMEQSLKDYPLEVVQKAHALLTSPAAFRSEKTDGPINFFLEVATKAAELKGTERRNYIWSKIAFAPGGFNKPRGTVISIVLDGVKEGVDANVLLKSFNKELDPTKYRRGEEAEVRQGQIDAAEKLVAKLNLASALPRRAARVEDLLGKLWEPKEVEEAAPTDASPFAALRKNVAKGKTTNLDDTVISGGRITFAKFQNDVLPKALSMDAYIPHARLGFRSYITAVDPEAQHLWSWESEDFKWPVSSYLYQHGSLPAQFGLKSNDWVEVTAIAPMNPNLEDSKRAANLPAGVTFILKGACDRGNGEGPTTAIFQENLRTELHPVSNVIAALGAETPLVDWELGAAAGLDIQEQGGGLQVRVFDGVLTTSYIIDRWN